MNNLLTKITSQKKPSTYADLAANTNQTIIREDNTVFVKDFIIPCSIGFYAHERDVKQQVRINIVADVNVEGYGHVVTVRDTVYPEQFIQYARDVANEGHFALLENFADTLARKCFAEARIEMLEITVEKIETACEAQSLGFSASYSRS
jgi:dihydroneopterin aldolase